MIENEVKCIAFLPCRKGSERVKQKNTRRFADVDDGLISIKLRQLLTVAEIDEIFLSTNDEKIIEYAVELNEPRIIIDRREEELCSSATSTDSLIKYVSENIANSVILWTHVTSPFISAKIYSAAIANYCEQVLCGEFDSLMTVNQIQKFIWNENSPVNYDRGVEKWPRTQTLPALYEVNSGIFMAHTDVYRKLGDRIGEKPYLMKIHDLVSFDIDWEENWIIAEQMYLKNISDV